MKNMAIYGMIYLGSLLMVFNIYGFVQYARIIKRREKLGKEANILHLPILLLVMFLLGYLAVGLFGNPGLIMSGILFGGSVFVFVMYLLLERITQQIIEKERLEAELNASEQSNRLKSSFLASISHEMRTPMNVILSLNALAEKNPGLSKEVQDQLRKVGHSAEHLLDLINTMLDVQQIENGTLEVREEEFSLRDMTDRISAIVDTLCREKGLTYRCSVEEAAQGRYVGDSILLRQALLNLTDNAVKFTDAPGDVAFSVERIAENENARVLRFSVTDTGIGMSPEFLSKAFDAFTQEDATFTTRHGGSGMGLSAAKKKVKLLGGEIAAVSRQNEGSTFMVTVPLKLAAEESEAAAGGEAASLEGCRVLIADDILENAEISADLLELEGAESERAENGEKVLEMFRDSAPDYYDAILMDLRMPVMDGLEAARRIRGLERADAKTVPIIALTANVYDCDVQNCKAAGMNAHLKKPVEVELLYSTLRQCIGEARNSRRETESC